MFLSSIFPSSYSLFHASSPFYSFSILEMRKTSEQLWIKSVFSAEGHIFNIIWYYLIYVLTYIDCSERVSNQHKYISVRDILKHLYWKSFVIL